MSIANNFALSHQLLIIDFSMPTTISLHWNLGEIKPPPDPSPLYTHPVVVRLVLSLLELSILLDPS